jgi:ABC-type sugar transport system ATPase subunit
LAKKGKSIIIFSSELEELIGLSNRILVLNKGRIAGQLENEDINQANIMHLAS